MQKGLESRESSVKDEFLLLLTELGSELGHLESLGGSVS